MAERRMFAKTIIDSDAFLEMPQSTQLLYFHLSMRGDDDGFINKPKAIMHMVGCKDDDMKILIAKKFIIPFESGIVVIKHWKIHNYIQSDRYNETKYKLEKSMLEYDENKAYRLPDTTCIQPVSNMEPQVRLELGKDRIDKIIYSTHVLLTLKEYEKLVSEYGELTTKDYIERLSDYIEQIGVKKATAKYKSHYATIRNWYRRDNPNGTDKQPNGENKQNPGYDKSKWLATDD